MAARASEVAVGARLSLAIEISGAEDVESVPFHVVYNPAVLEFQNAEEGPFLSAEGKTAFFAAPMSSGNEVVVGLSRLGGGSGASGEGGLCVLHFLVVGPGEAGLAFTRGRVRDSTNRIVPSMFKPAAITAR